MTLEECRCFYADEVRFAAGLGSSELVDAFARVPREEFLGPGPWELGSPDASAMSAASMTLRWLRVDDPRNLYHNVLVALDKAADINNGQPSALACWINALNLQKNEHVYHLGCGVGYYTAIMAEVVGDAGSVVGTEVRPDLAARAQQNLGRYPNVAVHATDGASFDPGACDAILVNAGVTHPLPVWLDRLHDGGRLVVPITVAVNPKIGFGVMTRIVRRAGTFSAEVVSTVGIYSCTSARDPEREPLLRTAMASGALMKITSIRRDAHDLCDSCVVHGSGACLSSAAIA